MKSLRTAACLVAAAVLAPGNAPAQDAPPAAGPVDLMSVCADALQSNARYRAALAAYRAQKELLPQAEGKLLPQLALTGDYTYVDEDLDGSYFGPLQFNAGKANFVDLPLKRHDGYLTNVYGATLSQTVFNMDQFYGWSEAEAKVKQAAYQLDVAQDELLINVANAYFGLLVAQGNARLALAKANDLGQQLDQMRSRAGAGLATEADLKLADAAFALATADELAARNAALGRAAQLATVTGHEYAAVRPMRADVVLAPPQPADEHAWSARARAQNPNVLAQTAAVEVAELLSKRASGRRWPQLDAVGGAWRSDADGGIPYRGQETLTRIGLRLTLPLYSGGQISSAVRQADAAAQSASALLDDARQQAELQSRLAYLDTMGGVQKVPALKRSLDASIAVIDATTGGFEAGTKTYADVLAAVQQRYAQESAYAVARYEFLVDSLKLKQAAGMLVPDDMAKLNHLLEAAYAPTP